MGPHWKRFFAAIRSVRFLLALSLLVATVLVRLDLHPGDDWSSTRRRLADFVGFLASMALAAALYRGFRVQNAKDQGATD